MSEESTFQDFVTNSSPQNLVTEIPETSTTEANSILGETRLTSLLVASPEIPHILEISLKSPAAESIFDETLSETKETFTPTQLPDNNNEFELDAVKIDEIEDNTPLTRIQQNLEHHRDFRNDDLKTPPANCPETPVNNNDSSTVPHDDTSTSKKSKRKRTKVRGDAFTVEFADEQPIHQPGSHFQGPDGPFGSYSRDEKEKFEKVNYFIF